MGYITNTLNLFIKIFHILNAEGLRGVLSVMRTKLVAKIFLHRMGWWEKRGIHVRPVHPWSPLVNSQKLDEDLWNEEKDLYGIDVNEDEQLELLAQFKKKYSDEYTRFPLSQEDSTNGEYYIENGTFETVDGEILYCMVREYEPNKIVQIGGGHSTRVIIQAIRNNGLDSEVKTYQPYRDQWIRSNPPDHCNLTGEWANNIDVSQFDEFESGDILFVDSTHVVRTNNDVYKVLFQILPRLPEGVLIHFHDIFLPKDYPIDWIIERNMSLNEQYVLRALLMWNNRIDIRWMGAYMHEYHPKELKSAFKSYDRSRIHPTGTMHIPNSIWLEVE